MIDVKELIELTKRPEIFEEAGAPFWVDEHISQQVLKIHLDPQVSKASRKPYVIRKTVDFIVSELALKTGTRLLDTGCGPGLYCEGFAQRGLSVVGIDFSKNSIAYARNSATEKNLNIEYHNNNYLQMDFHNEFDCCVIIFYDFCVLSYESRTQFLKKIYASLKPGGYFVFDVISDFDDHDKLPSSTWTPREGGFWRPNEHVELFNHFYYENENATLGQHIIINGNNLSVYRNYLKAYTDHEISDILCDSGFEVCRCYDDVMGTPKVQGSKSTGIIARKPRKV